MPDSLYVVAAQVVIRTDDGWDSSRQVPTFLLDPVIQGIVSADHAARIGLSILTTMLPYGPHHIDSIHVSVIGPGGTARLDKTFDKDNA